MGLDHHGAEVGVMRIALEALGLFGGERRPIHAVGSVNFLGDELDALTQRHLERIEELQIDGLVAGIDNGFGQLDGAFAAETPVIGSGAADTLLLAKPLDQLDFCFGIGVELVDADDGLDAGLLHGVDMVEQVLAALLQQLKILGLVLFGQRLAGNNSRAAAVHLEGADGADQNGNVGSQAAEASLDVPELLEADIRSEAGLSDMIVEQLEGETVADDGALADGDVGEGAGMYQAGLMLDGVAEGGVDGVAHPGGHGAVDLEVMGGDRVTLLVVRNDDVADTLAQILQVAGDGKDGHQLGAHGDAELGIHGEAIHLAFAEADLDVAQALGAEVNDPAHLDPLGIDIQPLEAALGKSFVAVVALVLHTGIQGDHGQVMGVHDVVDVAGEAQGELGHGHEQRIAAACCGALDIEGGAAGGLTQAAADVLAQLAEAFDQTQRGGGFAFAERSGGDGGDFDELAVRLILQTVHDLDEVKLRGLAVGDDLIRQKAHLLAELFHAGKGLFRFFRDLPVFVDCRVKHFGDFLLVKILTEFNATVLSMRLYNRLRFVVNSCRFGIPHKITAVLPEENDE